MENGIIDIQALEERVGGDRELLEEIIRIFLDRSPDVMARMAEAIGSHDARGLETAAHSLRGYLVNFYAKRSSDIALELEIKGRNNDWVYIEESFSNLQTDMALLLSGLTSLLQDIVQRPE